MKPTLYLLSCLLFTGCQTTPHDSTERPPRYGKSVIVTRYDPAPRSINPAFEVFAREADVPRPFKIIALISRNANPQDEGLMMNAIAWRAKQLGADGMIILPPSGGGWKYDQFGGIGGGQSGEPIFRAHGIVYVERKP